MSYKYRNDGTPDFVDSSESDDSSKDHALGIASDSTGKKKAPVDTVALKGRMDRDNASARFNGNQLDSDLAKRTSGGNADFDSHYKKFTSSVNSAKARSDTLDQARQTKKK